MKKRKAHTEETLEADNKNGNDHKKKPFLKTAKKKKHSPIASKTNTHTDDALEKESTEQQQEQQQQHPKTITITQQDHDRILKSLQTIDWNMAKNTSRRNVIREHDPDTPKLSDRNHKPYCQSFIFGRNMKDPNQAHSWWTTKYPTIYQELQSFLQKYNPRFQYTHITLNKNLRCKRHTDGGNAGLSYIIAIGKFTGGELQIEPPLSSSATSATVTTTTSTKRTATSRLETKIYNLHRTFVLFNGREQPHETLPFTGERYTLVYYTSDIIPKSEHIQNPSTASLLNHITEDPSDTTTTTEKKHSKVSDALTAKFNAMKKRLGRKR
jgi:hypothetical protein